MKRAVIQSLHELLCFSCTASTKQRKNESGEINIAFGWQQLDNLVFQTSILAQNFAALQKIVALLLNT